MPDFKVRTFEDTREVTADSMELAPEEIRFYTAGRITAAFSRYLWVEQVLPPAAPENPVEPETKPAAEPTQTESE